MYSSCLSIRSVMWLAVLYTNNSIKNKQKKEGRSQTSEKNGYTDQKTDLKYILE